MYGTLLSSGSWKGKVICTIETFLLQQKKKKKDKESVDEIPEAVQTERRARKGNTKGSNMIEERTVNDVQCRKDIEDGQDWAKGIYINFFLYW